MTGPPAYEDRRARPVDATAPDLWRVVAGLGGDRGWYGVPLAWELRGRVDRLVGGGGVRRGRRDPDRLRVGDPVDSWRVEQVVEGRRLLLRSEMRLPGTARLELTVAPAADGRSRLAQCASFVPDGAAGHAYWWAVSPFHRLVFGRMLVGIARAAEARSRSGDLGSGA
jgi:hypothetical protein